jgi:hypothetical protein
MTTTFTQTNVAADVAVEGTAFCSGNTANTGATGSTLCTVGGTAGSTPTDDTIDGVDASAATLNMIWMELTVPAGYNWESGTWTVRWDVQAGDMDVTCEEIHICEVEADYSPLISLASSTGIGRTINTNQVESFTVTQSAVSPIGANGNHIIIILAFSESGGHAAGNITWTPTQDITAPGTVFDVAEASGRQWLQPGHGNVDAVDILKGRDYLIPGHGNFNEANVEEFRRPVQPTYPDHHMIPIQPVPYGDMDPEVD